MTTYAFSKTNINTMYNESIEDSLNALVAKKPVPGIKLVIGEREILIPNNADTIEILFGALEECEETAF